MEKITEIELPENLSKFYKDYDLQGFGNIHRAKVSHNIKNGDIFNIYRTNSIKEGCEWLGDLKKSLDNHLQLEAEK